MTRSFPPGLGGVVDAEVSVESAERWLSYREQREQERMFEAWDPESARAKYRLSEDEAKSVPLSILVDLGRALFLREFTPTEGLGEGSRERVRLRRFHAGPAGGPDAQSCVNCHWKGGFAGGGDHVDNAFLDGDGDQIGTHLERNPPALWGLGWIERLAAEMSADLYAQSSAIQEEAQRIGEARRELVSKGIPFGELRATRSVDGVVIDASGVAGVADDLVVRPFGYNGRFARLRDMVNWSFQVHIGLQSDELVAAQPPYLRTLTEENGNGKNGSAVDPDGDGVESELENGQITAVTTFLATIDTPTIEVPTEAGWRSDPLVGIPEAKVALEFTDRWPAGHSVFESLGCASCHVPLLPLESAVFETGSRTIDLEVEAAKPHPAREDDGSFLVPLFSDLKLHDMGDGYGQRSQDFPDSGRRREASDHRFVTRPLWGLRKTGPYMHDGSANTVDQAVAMHGREGSAARESAEAFAALPEKEKADLRLFLHGLTRAATVRVR